LCWRVGDLDAVGEGHALDDLGQLVFILRSSPGFAAAMTNVNRISRAVYCDAAPLVRMDRWRTHSRSNWTHEIARLSRTVSQLDYKQFCLHVVFNAARTQKPSGFDYEAMFMTPGMQ
jgi:hypothetical protein